MVHSAYLESIVSHASVTSLTEDKQSNSGYLQDQGSGELETSKG